jgi:DNA-binding response OmpR family regulator
MKPQQEQPSEGSSAKPAPGTNGEGNPATAAADLDSLPPALRAALASREQVYRELGDERVDPVAALNALLAPGAPAPAAPPPAAAPPAAPSPAAPSPAAMPPPVTPAPAPAVAAAPAPVRPVREEPREAADPTLRQLERQRKELTQRLDAETRERNRWRAACAEAERRMAALQSELAELRGRLEREASTPTPKALQGGDVDSELRAKYQALVEAHEKQRQAHATEMGNLARQLSELRQRYEQQLAGQAEECERLREALKKERAQRGAPSTGSRRSERAREEARRDSAEATEGGELLIIDDDPIGREVTAQLAKSGYPVSAVVPQDDAPAQLADRAIACAAINLAVPQAWPLVRAMRAAPALHTVPLIAYALTPQSPTGFWFGPVDFALLPVATSDLGRIARQLVSGLKQAIVVSSDPEVANETCLALTKARVNASVARDRRQALDAMRVAAPQLVVVHPNSSPVDGFRAVAALRGVQMLQNLAVIFLLDETPDPREASLLSAAARTVLRLGSLTTGGLATTVAAAFRGAKPGLKLPAVINQ